MTRRVHRVPLGPFVVLFLIPILSHAQSTLSSLPSSSKPISTSTTIPSTTTSSTAASSTKTESLVATAAVEEPKNMLVTVSYIGIAVGCAVLAIFALTIFFSYRQRKARTEQPPMTDAKKEYIEYFRNQNNGNGSGGQGGAEQGAGNNGSWVNSMTNSNAKSTENTTHTRSGSKSSLARFHFRSSSKSQEPVVEPILKIEVTSNPSLRPASAFPESLVPKRLKAQQPKTTPFEGNNTSQMPHMPKFEVPGKIIYEDSRISAPPHAMTTSDNESGYKFPPRTTSRRAPPMPLAIRPFAPSSAAGTPRTIAIQSPQSFTAVGLSPTPPRRNEAQPQRAKNPYNQSQLSPIQMQPIRPYSPLESASGRNNEPQPYIPSWMDMPKQNPKLDMEPRSITPQQPKKPIPRELRPMSSTTIASDASRASHSFSDYEYSSYDEDDYSEDEDRNYDYQSQVYDSYRRSTDSYDDRRPLSARSYETGWSYGPSHSSRDKAQAAPRSHAEPYASSSQLSARDNRSGSNGRQKTPVPVNANSTLSPTTYINNRGGREAVKTSPVTPPPAPPPKDWEVIAIKMDPYPAFEATVRSSPAPRGYTPRPALKASGLPNNPKTKKQTGWDEDLERGYY
ncbi:hypothetical protein AOL_s00006g380 [Orbilia oligospora ATCC 24927]|uniref:Uncharacterized protein n=1 Tax=Arthrobotrys oligospora (strain ATCC 24927 / CBS 115.81 / DSM 1491) TaxID=756982 RepID=G1X0H9_ARTOA|nr:hypothetical protein AOL_s00006g380 [Orbilia oligospora ATCC 24927]EGX53514.1 hypothetical protein AOL_s00006g380 [Orbilia oligospora ATCC 24927]